MPQLGSCTSLVRACWPRAVELSLGGTHSLGAQPRPQVPELAASNVAHFTACDDPGDAERDDERPPFADE